jgi:acetyl-CoA acyltransferase
MDVYIAEAARTPFGSYFGSLSGIRADDLLARAIKGLLAKVPNLEPTSINDVVVGVWDYFSLDFRSLCQG